VPPPQPLTLAFLGYASAATADRSVAYEDEVLRLLESHGARLLFRGRRVSDQDESLPLEIQLLWFPHPEALNAYLADEQRQMLLTEYGNVRTSAQSFEVAAIEPSSMPSRPR
jgi:uncharacterized protein (DUF1330 family)